MTTASDYDLRRVKLFAGLDDGALAQLRAALREQVYAPGQIILREGDLSDGFYLIAQGRVRFSTRIGDGREEPLGEAGEAEYFGELAMLTQEPRAARVTAAELTVLLRLGEDDFQRLLTAHPHASLDMLRMLARRLQTSNRLLQDSGRSANALDDARAGLGDRLSDAIASVIGSWRFVIWLSATLLLWVGWNAFAGVHNMMHADNPWPVWDPYPFVFLNLALSFQAAYSAPIIMMSQNRAARKDRLVAEVDHRVNVKSELQTSQIIERLDAMEKSLHYRLSAPESR